MYWKSVSMIATSTLNNKWLQIKVHHFEALLYLPNQQCTFNRPPTKLQCRNFVTKHWLNIQIGAKRGKDVHATCACSSWASTWHATVGCWGQTPWKSATYPWHPATPLTPPRCSLARPCRPRRSRPRPRRRSRRCLRPGPCPPRLWGPEGSLRGGSLGHLDTIVIILYI